MVTLQKRNVRLDHDSHRYYDENDNTYLSVTQLINIFTPEFDGAFWAHKKAKETGMKPSAVLKEWEKNKNFSCDHGTSVHYDIEHINDTDVELSPKLTPIKALIDRLSLFSSELKHEVILYHPEYMVAGTADLVCISIDEQGRKCFKIYDWKTNNEEIKFEAGYFKKENGVKTDVFVKKDERLLGPLSHLQNCKGVRYALQISIYALIMEDWGMHFENGKIIQIFKDDKPNQSYDVPYLKDEARAMLEYYKKNRL